jgi:microcystin-dependent protein
MPAHEHTVGFSSVFYSTGTDYYIMQSSATQVPTSTVGGGLPHNNMPPFILKQFIVYAGV